MARNDAPVRPEPDASRADRPVESVLGVVIAMAPEAAALTGPRAWRRADGVCLAPAYPIGSCGLVVVRSGAGWENAYAAARRLVRQGAGALASLGLSGGLSPDLRPGHLIVARRCLMTDGLAPAQVWHAPPAASRLHRVLSAAGLPVCAGPILTTRVAALSPDSKAVLLKRFGALAVDMESAAVARAAAEAGLPWLSCRAVCDPADRAVPPPLAAALAADGRLRTSTIAAGLLRDPSLVRDLAVLAVQAGKACRSLRKAFGVMVRSGLAAALAAGGR